MKNKVFVLIGIICGVFLIVSIYFLMSNIFGCDKVFADSSVVNINAEAGVLQVNCKIDELGRSELVGLANSIDEAKMIAAQYGMEFVSFDTGVVVFATKEDVNTVIERCKKGGYINISPNCVQSGHNNSLNKHNIIY